MVVINLTIINSDSHSSSPCYGIMSNSFYRWVNSSSERISGSSKITEVVSDRNKFEPWSARFQTLTPFLTPLGKGGGVCISTATRSSQKCAVPPSRALLLLLFPPRFRGAQSGAVCSLWASIKPKVTSILQVWVYRLEPFQPRGGRELGRSWPSFWKPLSQTGPPLNPTVIGQQGLISFYLLTYWSNCKFRLATQIIIKIELVFTVTHLLDFQREFDICGCVLINRNIVIVISRPNYKKKIKPQIKICRKWCKGLFAAHYILCKVKHSIVNI